jgi:aspartate/methionine/tyrosine aminotransferase
MEILEKAHELEALGKSIVHLEVGEPDFDTPEAVKEAARTALTGGMTSYTHSLGILPLREAISRHYGERYGVEVNPDNIVVTSGTSPALALVFSVLLNPGEEVILSDPCYACYPNILEFVGGVPRYVTTREEEGFKYRHSDVEAMLGEGVKGVMVNSPSNPTGIVLSGDEMADLVDVVSERAFVISDEIYHGLVYEGRERSCLEFTDRCFVLNGFSKLYAMTGWRLGYVISPPEFSRALQKAQQNLYICANSFVQRAGIAALEETAAETAHMVGIYGERRRYMLDRVRRMGFGVAVEPTGAFYIFANAGRFTDDTYAFCLDVLSEALVAITPGIDFGPGGEGYIRFSYANSIENITEGMDRLEAYLGRKEGQ